MSIETMYYQDSPEQVRDNRLESMIDDLVSGVEVKLKCDIKVQHEDDLTVAVFENQDFGRALIEIAQQHPQSMLYSIMAEEAKRLSEEALDDEQDALSGAHEDYLDAMADDAYDNSRNGV